MHIYLGACLSIGTKNAFPDVVPSRSIVFNNPPVMAFLGDFDGKDRR